MREDDRCVKLAHAADLVVDASASGVGSAFGDARVSPRSRPDTPGRGRRRGPCLEFVHGAYRSSPHRASAAR